MGGNIIDYLVNVSTPTEDLTTLKVFINSTISTPGARFTMSDIKNFDLNTILKFGPHIFEPSSLYDDCKMRDYDDLLA